MSSRKPDRFDGIDAWLVATALITSVAVAFTHCSNDSVCGNGKQEDGEQCDKGAKNGMKNSGCSATCTIAALSVAQEQISITHLQNEAVGFEGASCSDLGATKQLVVLDGPDPINDTWDCTKSNFLRPSVTPGDYKLTVTLLDATGAALTNPVTSATVTAEEGKLVNLVVNFKQTDFLKQDYKGTLFFKPSWGADATSCTMAAPMVTGYGVTLKTAGGQVVGGMSTGNRALNGTEAPCFIPAANGTAEAVADLAWGHYTISFTGYAGTAVAYCKTFDVFNGPSASNVTYSLLVPSADVDAGACP